MVHVSSIFSVDDLYTEIHEGWVRVQKHPVFDFYIYNYTEKAQYSKHWNNVTLNCRGLVLDSNEQIIARPWKKFFNLGEGYIEFDMNDPVEVTDKMDGSLGILYKTPEGYAIATRGSFASDQAIHATAVWIDRYDNLVVPEVYTFLFEIIYKSNRIVLDYGDMDDLVLLGAVDKQYGYYYGPGEAAALLGWNGPVTQTFEYKTMQQAFSAPDRKNAEGFVIRCGHKQVKLKQTDYIELHRIVTNLSPRTVWARLAAGETVQSILDVIPDEFHAYVQEIAEKLEHDFIGIKHHVVANYGIIMRELGSDFSRRDFAMLAQKSPLAKYLFLMLDNKSIDELVWQQIKPKMEAQDVELPE